MNHSFSEWTKLIFWINLISDSKVIAKRSTLSWQIVTMECKRCVHFYETSTVSNVKGNTHEWKWRVNRSPSCNFVSRKKCSAKYLRFWYKESLFRQIITIHLYFDDPYGGERRLHHSNKPARCARGLLNRDATFVLLHMGHQNKGGLLNYFNKTIFRMFL